MVSMASSTIISLDIYSNASYYYINLAACIALVLFGGLLAGLTIGYMSLDELNLAVLATSGTQSQRQYARRIQPLRKNGHWLLVTLLLGNTVVNETLPVVMHSTLGGAFFAYPVAILQLVLSPLGYPIARLLDYILGANHSLIYKKPQLKELVSLSDAEHGGSLSRDEVTIIRGALDLGEKLVEDVMTDLKNVYMVDIDCKLDCRLLTEMLRKGYSRVPVFSGDRMNVIGVLLVKSLLLVDPDDCIPLAQAKIAPIPVVTIHNSLYDILNAFQDGGSHMAIVIGPASPFLHSGSCINKSVLDSTSKSTSIYIQDNRPNGYVPIGIITLEDVIEELIQEEIIDETDVFVDIRKRIRVVRATSATYQYQAIMSAVTEPLLPKTKDDKAPGHSAITEQAFSLRSSEIERLQARLKHEQHAPQSTVRRKRFAFSLRKRRDVENATLGGYGRDEVAEWTANSQALLSSDILADAGTDTVVSSTAAESPSARSSSHSYSNSHGDNSIHSICTI
ncbi:hypothetical protein GGI26_000153 [Coemansia sp. RSA 1358]|uniref:CNNM transmembrane domain-containing protein n=1 Tax=Coemansia umbellata TaxID=1424467 RepID=A0ABQ8PVW6_9FUNG|nr:hypothetical protein EDC05_000064 [Coemansia umbellata]KAJ2626069.1 hypothetical protein GGI26_000153 [Coemansia sp. RSA 1358]